MNITFLIGNGFDLNLGLDTDYNSFIENHYTKIKSGSNKLMDRFKREILANKEQWSDAEKAFGEYTERFSGSFAGINFCDCHENFCVELANYLKQQERRIHIRKGDSAAEEAFVSSIRDITKGLRYAQSNKIDFQILYGGNIEYNFINFNYTRTLDRYVSASRHSSLLKTQSILSSSSTEDRIDEVIHVHGTVNEDMVLGVNDKTQIKKISIFDGIEAEYLKQIIKPDTNEMNQQDADQRTYDILSKSDIIYIYGMSLGDTDALWWKRICDILVGNEKLIVMIHVFNAPPEALIRTRTVIFENSIKDRLLNFYDIDILSNDSIRNRIYIVKNNIFSNLKNVAQEIEKDDAPQTA